MYQRRAVSAEFALGAVEPQHGLALAFGDRLPHLPAIHRQREERIAYITTVATETANALQARYYDLNLSDEHDDDMITE